MRDPDDALKARILGGLRDLGCDADHPVRISELRRILRLVGPNDLHRLLLDLETSGNVQLSPERLTAADDFESVFHLRRGPLVLVRLTPERGSKESWASLRERVIEKLGVLERGRCACRPIAWLRRVLPDVPREELDRALVTLELAGVVELTAAKAPDGLAAPVKRGAIDGHHRGLLAYVAPK